MTTLTPKRSLAVMAVLWAIGSIAVLDAQLGVGTWVQTIDGKPTGMVMTVEPCCGTGYRLTYRAGQANAGVLMVVESPFDGKDVPVLMNGKPSGETMGIKRVDALHTFTILKMNGQQIGTSKSTLSADGKTLTVENDMTMGGAPAQAGKKIEIWTKK